jgi:hypothetical membrane protein
MVGFGGPAFTTRLAAQPDEVVQVRRSRVLFALAIAGLLLYVALDVIAQSLPPHYSPVSQAESDLAVGPYGYLMTLNFINRGGLSLCFLFAVLLAASSADTMSPRLRKGAYLFVLWSLGALLLAVFPTDVPPTPVTWHGAIHLLVAVVAFLGGALGALYISLGMAGNRSIAIARGVALPLAYLTVVLCVVELFGGFAAPGFSADYGGLVERIFLGSVLFWIGSVSAIMLLRLRLQGSPIS